MERRLADGRLALLGLGTAVVVAAATRVPFLVPAVALLVPVAALAGAVLGGRLGWIVTTAPAAVALALAAPGEIGAYVAVALVGPVTAAVLARGRSPGVALAVGAIPWAVWTAGLVLSGFQPFPPEARARVEALLAESAGRGDIPIERLGEVRESTDLALAALDRTWVATESTWHWVLLVVAWLVARRLFGPGPTGAARPEPARPGLARPGFVRLGRFARFDFPDAVVGGLIAGLALVLVPGEAASAARTVGWNLVTAAAFVYGVRGLAIEWYWMERARWRTPWRVLALAGGALLFLPALLAGTIGLGLFDTWFDFRRVRTSESGGNPLSVQHRSPGDDLPRNESGKE